MISISLTIWTNFRDQQKREHIISELQKKRELTQKKAQNLTMTMPNIDPFANDKQRLLQLDPTVVGNVSHTTGSSKQFTNEQYVSRKSNHVPPVSIATTMNDQRTNNRTQQQQQQQQQQHDDDVPPPIPPKDNRAPYYKREEENPFASQRPLKTSHERMYVPFENDTRYSPTHGQHLDMMPLQEKQPRVIVRSIRDDEKYPPFYQQQTNFDDSTPTFVSIPVQIEHSGSPQRFSSPYHSDPYYPHINSWSTVRKSALDTNFTQILSHASLSLSLAVSASVCLFFFSPSSVYSKQNRSSLNEEFVIQSPSITFSQILQ